MTAAAHARRGQRRRPVGWARIGRYAVVACLVGILTPVAAFLVGWLFIDVPSPAQLAAASKQVTKIMAADGTTEIGRYVPEQGNRVEVELQRVPEHVRKAVLAAEDRSFYSNPGFDVVGIARAAWDQLTGGDSGGSTITQQYVKVATGNDDYSYIRKYREVIIAAKLTKNSSKDEILENYLNTIYFGRNSYGIQAASQAYFDKDASELTVSEGALLAGMIRSPSALDPAKNPDAARARWNYVLNGMVSEGWLTAGQRARLQLPDTVPPQEGIPGTPTDDRAHIVSQVLSELERQGISRSQLAVEGGKIITTIDPEAQQAAREAVTAELEGQPENLHSALVAVDPNSGAVLAYYGGENGVGYDLAGGPAWSPGSAFKPFTMLAALKQGISINSVYDADSPLRVNGLTFANSGGDSYEALRLREAMTKSVNTTFVQLAADVGPGAVRKAAIAAGIPKRVDGHKSLVEPNGSPGLGITLGQYPVHVIDMANAYATFANDGVAHEPFFVSTYVNASGVTQYTHQTDPEQALDLDDAEHNTQLARNVTATLTRVAEYSGFAIGREVAAKTGTHQLADTGHNSAAWTIGYTPSISTAVWVGDPAHTALVNAAGADIFGAMLPGSIWQRFMSSYLEGTEPEEFPPFEVLGDRSGPAAAQVVASEETTQEEPTTEPSEIPESSPRPSADPSSSRTPSAWPRPSDENRRPEVMTYECDFFDACSGGGQPPSAEPDREQRRPEASRDDQPPESSEPSEVRGADGGGGPDSGGR